MTLDIKGIALALAIGAALLFLGQGTGYFFLFTMLVFLVLSAVVTHAGSSYKRRLLGGNCQRGVRNVLANGIPPLMMAAVFFLFAASGTPRLAALSVVGYVSSVAAITADKFESEIGIFDGLPRLIFGFRKVRRGTSGALTMLGLGAGVLGSLLIALLLIIAVPELQAAYGAQAGIAETAVLSVVAGGMAGSVIDSVFGYYEEKGVGNKYTTNFMCGVFGGIVGMLLFALL